MARTSSACKPETPNANRFVSVPAVGILALQGGEDVKSQTCSKCGHQSSTNRNSDGWFECNDCGYSVDGDYNASKNIGLKLLTLPEGKRPSGLGDGHLALKSGMLNGNGDYTAYDVSSSDRESTDKPTTSVVGR
ncbi:transposase [Halorarius litoreus]|uniref:transposase n=1 Tax=Halorarius litoreus TaxID=2962676 RepID=UPI0020CE14ED|nr:transposase [Halorarius litoreus]